MMFIRRFTRCFLILTTLLFANLSSAYASDVAIVYSTPISNVMTDDPERPGIGFEIVTALFKEIGHDFKIEVLPWARAQHMAQNSPEALIFPLSWTPTRSEKYKWGVNIFNNETHFISFNGKKLTKEEAKEKHIGVQLKSSWDNWLTEQGYEQVYRVPGEGSELLKLLRNNRIDAWYTDTIIAGSVLRGLEDPGITYSDPIQIFKTYLATNVNSPYPYYDDLIKALDKLRQSGKINQIFAKYSVPPRY